MSHIQKNGYRSKNQQLCILALLLVNFNKVFYRLILLFGKNCKKIMFWDLEVMELYSIKLFRIKRYSYLFSLFNVVSSALNLLITISWPPLRRNISTLKWFVPQHTFLLKSKRSSLLIMSRSKLVRRILSWNLNMIWLNIYNLWESRLLLKEERKYTTRQWKWALFGDSYQGQVNLIN